MIEIPGYTILRELGRGGMATVYLARQDRLGREVALKIMQPPPTAVGDFTARFIKEGRIIARLQHPQIVTIYELNIADGLHYFSMEYLPNGTLSDHIAQGLSPDEAIDLTRRIAQALSVAHDHGVIHRDIKPQNILFRSDGTPVLTDFGIARAAGADPDATHLTAIGVVIGSPRYMSPEQSMSKPIDARSDLYSLGVVFHEMLTGEPPYRADDAISLAMKHCSEPIPRLPDPLKRIQPTLDKMLAKNPEDRFSSSQQLIRALDDLQAGRDGLAPSHESDTRIVSRRRPAQATTTVELPAPRGRKRLVLIIAAALAVPISAVVYFVARTPPLEVAPDDAPISLPRPSDGRSKIAERYEMLALEHLRDGDLERSLELVELALQDNAEDPRLQALKARVLDRIEAGKLQAEAEQRLAGNELDESLALIEKGLALVPDHPALTALRVQATEARSAHHAEQARELLTRAEGAFRRGELAESMELTMRGLTFDEENARLKALEARLQTELERQRTLREITERAESAFDEGLLREALGATEKGLALAPDDAGLLRLKSRVTEQIEKEKARRADEALTEAKRRLDQKELDASLAAIERGLALVPDHPGLVGLRERVDRERANRLAAQVSSLLQDAESAFERGDLVESLRLCNEGLALAPEDGRLNRLRSRIEGRLSSEKASAQILKQASGLVGQGRLPAALRMLESALASDPRNAELQRLREGVKQRIELQEAEKAAAEALGRARELLARGDLPGSLQTLEDALALYPKDQGLRDLLGEVKQKQRQQDDQKVQDLAKRASELLSAGDLDAASELLREALALRPQDPELLRLRDQIASRQSLAERIDRRLQDCSAALAPVGDTPAPSVAAIDALASAAACYREVLGLDAEDARAGAGLAEARERIATLFNRTLGEGDLETAGWAIEIMERSDAAHPQLREMRQKLNEVKLLVPAMATIEGGCFQMGSPEKEPGREADEKAHRACVDDFKLAKLETRVKDFARFVDTKGFETDAERGIGGVTGCWALDLDDEENPWSYKGWANWRKPNKYQDTSPDEPVTCVSRNDAEAYIGWLNEATGQQFRLPTEAEWEYAARASTRTSRFWGNGNGENACRYANVADAGHGWDAGFPCDDGYEWTAPTGTFAPNPLELHDMLGNVLEWTCSEYDPGYGGSETRCAAAASEAPLVMRGGAWNSGPAAVRAAYRNRNYPESRYNFVGFRVARDADSSKPTPSP